MMKPPSCRPFPAAAKYRRKAVRSLHYDGQILTIDIQGEGFAFARVIFRDPRGFRVLDESELCEFWNSYSEANGWLYEVDQGGWRELESHRPDFNASTFVDRFVEYLLVDDKCVSVLSEAPPEIVDLGTDPQRHRG
jgi:hypothetical protein